MRRFRLSVPVILLLLAFTLPMFAQQKPTTPLIPREILFGNPEKAGPQISPDGTQLAYLAPDNGVLNVWVRTLGKTDDHVITADKKRGIRQYFWQYDSKHIVFLQDRDGDENWHVYQVDLVAKNARDLTPGTGKVRADIVAADPSHPDELLVQLNKRDPKLMDVHRVNLKTGEVTPDTENPGDIASWTADNDLQVRAAEATTKDGGRIIRVRNDSKSPWRDILTMGPDETMGGVRGFTPDNKAIWVSSSVDANAARLVQIDIATGKQTVIAEDPQFDISGLATQPKTNALQAVMFMRARRDWKVLDQSIAADIDTIKKVRDGDFSFGSRSLDDKKWVVSYVNDNGPVYYYLYDRPTKKATLLFSNQPKLEQYQLSSMKPVEFKARDGMNIYGYLTLPAGMQPKNLPMIVFVHGGPWGRDTWGLSPYAQWLSNRGYAVLQINFRGSTGYGKKYLNAGDKEWGAKMHTDLLDGKEWAIKQGYVDPKKVCIMGGSYGGYATLAAVTFTPEEFACGVDIVGPSNLNTLLKTIPPYWATIKATFDKRMGTDFEFLNSRSPLFKADHIKVPLLIGQGANDPRVNKAESDQIVEAMRKKNLPVDYYVFPDEGHGFARPQNNKAFNAATEQFLGKNLGGRVEPPTEEEAKLLESVKK